MCIRFFAVETLPTISHLWNAFNEGNGARCLHWAALGGHQDVVEYLIKQEQGQDLLMTPDEKDRTPLHLAASA